MSQPAERHPVLSHLAELWELQPQELLTVGDSANAQGVVESAGGYIASARTAAGVVEAIRARIPAASPDWLGHETETVTHAHWSHQ